MNTDVLWAWFGSFVISLITFAAALFAVGKLVGLMSSEATAITNFGFITLTAGVLTAVCVGIASYESMNK